MASHRSALTCRQNSHLGSPFLGLDVHALGRRRALAVWKPVFARAKPSGVFEIYFVAGLWPVLIIVFRSLGAPAPQTPRVWGLPLPKPPAGGVWGGWGAGAPQGAKMYIIVCLWPKAWYEFVTFESAQVRTLPLHIAAISQGHDPSSNQGQRKDPDNSIDECSPTSTTKQHVQQLHRVENQ